MRFMLTLSIAATTALMAAWAADAQSIPLTITPTPADAQAIPAQGPGQIFLAAPDKDSSWRGLVWPSLTGGGLERLSLANGDGLRGTFVSAVSVVNNASTSYTVLFEQPANLSGSEALQVLRNSGGAWTVASGACINADGQVEVDGTTQSEYVMLRANACN